MCTELIFMLWNKMTRACACSSHSKMDKLWPPWMKRISNNNTHIQRAPRIYFPHHYTTSSQPLLTQSRLGPWIMLLMQILQIGAELNFFFNCPVWKGLPVPTVVTDGCSWQTDVLISFYRLFALRFKVLLSKMFITTSVKSSNFS